jgi:hypothetical protein
MRAAAVAGVVGVDNTNRRRIPGGPAADAAHHEKGQRRGDSSELPMLPVPLLRDEVSDPEACRYWPAGLRCEGGAQCLPLLVILRQSRPRLGVHRKIGVDGLGVRGLQPPIDPGL